MYSSKRKVRSNGKTVVGQVSSSKKKGVQFESSIEEGFLYILNFDSDVTGFHDQPLQIEYADDKGASRIYTPDFLVEYRNRSNVLFEVKPSKFLQENRDKLTPVFKAAGQFAQKRGWEFSVITDREIKTEYCDNVRFLLRYQTYHLDISVINEVLTTLSKTATSTPNLLLEKLSTDNDDRAIYVAAIWRLMFDKQIGCNLFKKIHMNARIWVAGNREMKELKYPYHSC